MGPARRPCRRTGPENHFERDLDEVLDRLPPDRVEPDRLLPERDDFALLELDLLEPDRDALARERDELELERERDDDDPPDLREPEDRLPDVVRDLADELLRELVDLPFDELRELLEERRELERRREDPPLRSAAGISSRATAFASCVICFSRNFAIRSSSRLIARASFAVSLSPTVSASDSMLE